MIFDELKKLFGEWLKRWLLPDFTNKLTWLVVSAGVSLIGLANPIFDLFIYVAEFLIRELGYSIKLPIINFNSPGWGTALVCLGLAHNLGTKYVASKERDQAKDSVDADRKLFNQFIALLPSYSPSIETLKNHDFGGIYRSEQLAGIEEFVTVWSGPEYRYHDEVLNNLLCDFYNEATNFWNLHGHATGPTGEGGRSVMPDYWRGRCDMPVELQDKIKKEIRELNETASILYNMHQELVQKSKEILKI